jgi:YaiO family outer membrane protein
VEWRFTGSSRAGGEIEAETRQGGVVTDVLFQATGAWDPGRHLVLAGAAGGTPAADFFPSLTAWIEPAWRFLPGSTAGLRVWWMDATDASTLVLSPLVDAQVGPWLLRARSWHSPSADAAWHHFGLLRLGRDLPSGFWVEAGAGAGNGVDYLVLRPSIPDRSWLVLVDGAWAATPLFRLRLATAWRQETAGGLAYRELRVTAGVERAF